MASPQTFSSSTLSVELHQPRSHGVERPMQTTAKPQTTRRSTDPSPASPSHQAMSLPHRPRNTSPYSRAGHRSRSSESSLTAPAMIRAHSSPGIDEAGHVLMSTVSTRPLSPPGQYHRYHSPSRRSAEEGSPHATKYSLAGIGETVYEEAELEENPHMDDTHFMHNSPAMATNPGNTFPRRHRPSSPLTNITQQRAHTTASPSAVVALTRFNEGFPGSSSNSISFSSNSSVASTPTSTRSRSPSISSLETIPDSPAAEEAALEAERIATLKAIAEAAEGEDAATGREAGRRSSLEVPGSGGRGRNIVVGPGGSGSSYGSRDKRKRWSVCGAERRGDLDLETIWED